MISVFFNNEVKDMFRRATMQRTWPEGEFDWSGTTETYHWLEVKPDVWMGTNRLCENEAEAIEIQNETGYGERKTKTLAIGCATRYLQLTADPNTLKIFDPA